MTHKNNIKSAFLDSITVMNQFIADEENIQKLNDLATEISRILEQRSRVLICGNGGSHCDAMHFAEEFTGRYRKNREALPVLALGSAPHLTCVANDFGFDQVFSREVQAFGHGGDLLIVLSTSGNSENAYQAILQAKNQGIKTAAFLGKTGGKIKGHCDYEWIVEAETADRIQEVHMAALHILIEAVERDLFPHHYEEN